MALIKCPDCDKEISDSAESCVHCGYPLKKDATDAKPQAEANMAVIQKGKSPVKDRKTGKTDWKRPCFASIPFIFKIGCLLSRPFIISEGQSNS